MKSLNFSDIRPIAAGNWLAILGHVAPSLIDAIEVQPKHCVCPVHGGKDGFRLYSDSDSSGGGICNSCGAYSDGFALIAWVNGWSLPDTLQAVADYLGISSTSKTPKPILKRSPVIPDPIKEARTIQRKRNALNTIKSGLVSLSNEQAKTSRDYLINRGLGAVLKSLPSNLFYHPSLPYFEDGKDHGNHPALVALIRDKHGQPVTYHRTYLSQAGGKADLPTIKKLMSPIKQGGTRGGAIRLYQPTDELVLAEGVETALSLNVLLGKPVWACVSAGGLESVQIPAMVKRVIIAGDNDKNGTGEKSCKVLAERLLNENETLEIKIILPEKSGQDWLNVLNDKQDKKDHAA